MKKRVRICACTGKMCDLTCGYCHYARIDIDGDGYFDMICDLYKKKVQSDSPACANYK